jgi:hypothetical protein
MGGGGGGGKQTSTTAYNVPPELQQILGMAGGGMQSLLGGLIPQSGMLTGFNPQQIPNLSPQEQQLIQQLSGMWGQTPQFGGFNPNAPTSPEFGKAPTGPQFGKAPVFGGYNMNAPQGPAMETVAQLGQIGTNPLFTAFQQTELPRLLQSQSLSGLGQGAQAEAISQAGLREAENIAGYNLNQVASDNAARQQGYQNAFQQWQAQNQLRGQGWQNQMQGWQAQNQAQQQQFQNQFQGWQAQNQNLQQQYQNQFQNWQTQNQLKQLGFGNELQSWQNQLQALQQGLTASGLGRQITGQQQQAQYNELNALRTLMEQVIGAPFGALSSTIGSTTKTTGGGK